MYQTVWEISRGSGSQISARPKVPCRSRDGPIISVVELPSISSVHRVTEVYYPKAGSGGCDIIAPSTASPFLIK